MSAGTVRSKRLKRRLNAHWAGHERLDGNGRRLLALQTLAKAFPMAHDHIDVVMLKSPHRRSEVLYLAEDDHVIVLDLAYTSAVSTIARLLSAGERYPPPVSQAVMAGMLGWGFFVSGNQRASSILVTESLRRLSDMAPLAQPVTNDAGTGVGLFVLLHEGAHVVASSEAFDSRISRAMVTATAEKFARAAEGMVEAIEAGRARPGREFGGYIPDNPEDIAHFRWQFETYRSMVDEATDLIDELECDLIALSALLDMRFGSKIVEGEYPRLPTDRLKEVGDVLIISLRALRSMQMISLIRSETAAMTNQDRIGSFARSFAELMARQQVGTAMASDLFALLADLSDPTEATHGPDAYREAFLAALTALLDPDKDAVLTASNDWFEIIRDAKTFETLRLAGLPNVTQYADAVGISSEDHTTVALGLMERLPF